MLTLRTTKLLSLLVVSAFLFSFSPPKVYQTDFSGSWSLNENKSELGQFGARGAASKIVAEQKGNDITVTRTSTSFQGETLTSTETLTADGKTSESAFAGTGKKKSTMKWSADGQTLTITYSIALDFNGQSLELSGVETWSLGADGKTLSLQTTLTTPQGEIATKAVYDKQ